MLHACRSVLQQVVGHSEYFLGILPDGSGLAAPLNPAFKAPIQLGRQVLAQLAGAPERCVGVVCRACGEGLLSMAWVVVSSPPRGACGGGRDAVEKTETLEECGKLLCG